MDLSIVIVNWRSARYLDVCLRSIYAETQELDFEIVVVDNGSCDDALSAVLARFQSVRFVASDVNLGFAGANNLGASRCCGRNLLFLNPDTEVIGSALRDLVLFLDRTADAAIAGPTLLNSDLTVQTSCVQRFPSVMYLTLDSQLARRLLPFEFLWGRQPTLHDEISGQVEVVSGASLVCKADVFRSIGGFNMIYFMYTEDVDLCYSALQLGRKCYYVPSAMVVHHGGSSSGEREENHFGAVVMRESLFRFLRHNRGAASAVAFRCSTATVACVRITIAGLLMIGSQRRRRIFRNSVNKWVHLLRWTVGLESWASDLRSQPSTSIVHHAAQNGPARPAHR